MRTPRVPCKIGLALLISYLVFVVAIGLRMARNETEWLVITAPSTLLTIAYIVCVMGEVVEYRDKQEPRHKCSCGNFFRDFGSVLSFWGLVLVALGASIIILAKTPHINITVVPEPVKKGIKINVGEFMVLLGVLYSVSALLFLGLDYYFSSRSSRG